MTLTVIEPPWEVHTPRGKADVLAVIDYSQESYVYFLTAQRGTGDFWIYRNDKCQLFWNESTGLGKREVVPDIRGTPESWAPPGYEGYCRIDENNVSWMWIRGEWRKISAQF